MLDLGELKGEPVTTLGLGVVQAGVAKNASNNAAQVQMASFASNEAIQLGQQNMVSTLGGQWATGANASSQALLDLGVAGFDALNTAGDQTVTVATAGFDATIVGMNNLNDLGQHGITTVGDVGTAGMQNLTDLGKWGMEGIWLTAEMGMSGMETLGTQGMTDLTAHPVAKTIAIKVRPNFITLFIVVSPLCVKLLCYEFLNETHIKYFYQCMIPP